MAQDSECLPLSYLNGRFALNLGKSDKLEPMLVAMGVSWAIRGIADSSSVTQELKYEDGTLTQNIVGYMGNKSESWKADGIAVNRVHERIGPSKQTLTVEGNKLVLHIKADDGSVELKQEFFAPTEKSYTFRIIFTKKDSASIIINRRFDRL